MILLHRRNGKPWQFKWDYDYNAYIHKTRYGNIYKIFCTLESWDRKPIWIGRLVPGVTWYTVEREIRADYFDIGCGIIVKFPKN